MEERKTGTNKEERRREEKEKVKEGWNAERNRGKTNE